MKKQLKQIVAFILICFVFAGCSSVNQQMDLWENATYTTDTNLGDGNITLYLTVEAQDKSVCFTIKTNENIVGEALKEHNLISGEQGAYGLYVKNVNGIAADYNTDKSYWSFNKNGVYMSTGVDVTEFADGDKFELVYTK